MSVYFVSKIGDGSQVKIGHASVVEARLQSLMGEFENGIELLAVCPGDVSTERALHAVFTADWIEGEWYRKSDALSALIFQFSPNVTGRRVWSRLRAVRSLPLTPLDEDRNIAFALLEKLVIRFSEVPLLKAREKAFLLLHEINPIWSRRRVRAIWEKTSRRIDHFEIRNLQEAAYRQSASRLGRLDLPGNEGGK